MRYEAPFGSVDANAPYVDRNTPGAVSGSRVPAAAIENPQRELVQILIDRGFTPSAADLGQISKALKVAMMGRVDVPVFGWQATPPGSPGILDTYLVATGATGAWAAFPNRITVWTGANWAFFDPVLGLQVQYWSGRQIVLRYNGSGVWEEDVASQTAAGRVRIATAAESAAGVLNNVAVPPSGIRRRLSASIALYVATTGSDSNDGFSAGTPFLTLQKAVEYARTVDTAGFSITINVANGTYSGAGAILTAPLIGGGSLYFTGNPSNPALCVVNNTQSTGNASAFVATGGGQIVVNGFQVQSAIGDGLFAQGSGSVVSYQNILFGPCTSGAHVRAFGGGQAIIQAGTYTIAQSAQYHFMCTQGGSIYNNAGAITVTISGTLTFSQAFAAANLSSSQNLQVLTFSGGSVTGLRYAAASTSTIFTGGGGVNYFPGSIAGTVTGNGYYG